MILPEKTQNLNIFFHIKFTCDSSVSLKKSLNNYSRGNYHVKSSKEIIIKCIFYSQNNLGQNKHVPEHNAEEHKEFPHFELFQTTPCEIYEMLWYPFLHRG